MFATFVARLRSVVRRVATSISTTTRKALRPAPIAVGLVRDLFRTRDELISENAALRQQLIVASRTVKRPALRSWERGLLVVLASRLRNWHNTILLVKPETVLRWHREGFRLLWTRRSKPKTRREARIAPDTVELIRRMAADNHTWGAERIRGELLKLGLRIAKRTIQSHLRRARPPGVGDRQIPRRIGESRGRVIGAVHHSPVKIWARKHGPA